MKTIADFRVSLTNLSKTELEDMKKELEKEISKMIMDNELILKMAVVEGLLQEKGEE